MSTTTSAQPAQLTRNERLDRLPFNKAHRKLLVASGIGWAFDAMDVGLVSFVVAAIAADPHFNLTPTEKSWVLSIGFVGMAIGAGMYWVGLITTVIMMVAQVVLHRFPVAGDAAVTQELAVCMADTPELHQALNRLLNDHGGCVTDSALSRDDVHIAMELTVRLAEPITYEEALRFMQEHPGVERLSV